MRLEVRSQRTGARRAAGMVAAVIATVLAACGGGGGREPTMAPRLGEVCEVVGIAERRILEPAGSGFADLVADPTWDDDQRAAVAAVRVVGEGVDAGRFQPLVDHLVERHRRQVDEAGRRDPPRSTPAVRALAAELDRELADGGCG